MKLRLLAEPTGNETNKQTIKRDKTKQNKAKIRLSSLVRLCPKTLHKGFVTGIPIES